jgi:hypothetical protein
MTIYVHEPIDYGRDHNATTRRLGGKWSHAATDGDVAELVAFAEHIGLKRAWLQGTSPRDYHFDLTPGKYFAALRAGAVRVTATELARLCWRRERLDHVGTQENSQEHPRRAMDL